MPAASGASSRNGDRLEDARAAGIQTRADLDDGKLAAAIAACKEASEKFHEPWLMTCLLRLAFYHGLHGMVFDRSKRRLFETASPIGRHNTLANAYRIGCDTLVARATSGKIMGKGLAADPNGVLDQQGASAVNNLVVGMEHERQIARHRKSWIWEATNSDRAYLYQDWDPKLIDWVPDPGDPMAGRPPGVARSRVGNIRISAESPSHVLPCPGVRQWDDVPWVVWRQIMTLWELEQYAPGSIGVRAQSAPTVAPMLQTESQILHGGWGSAWSDPAVMAVEVLHFWHKPCREWPEGGYACVAGGQVVARENRLPFADGELPFTPLEWPQRSAPSLPVVPLQRAYNQMLCNLLDVGFGLGEPTVGLPPGCDVTDIRRREGIRYLHLKANIAGSPNMPVMMQPSGSCPVMTEGLSLLRREIDDAWSVHDISKGVGSQTSDTATETSILRQTDDTRPGSFYENIEMAEAAACARRISLAKQFYKYDRMVWKLGENGQNEAAVLRASDIPAAVRVYVEPGSVVQENATTRRAQAAQLMPLLLQVSMQPTPAGVASLKWALNRMGEQGTEPIIEALTQQLQQMMSQAATAGQAQVAQQAEQASMAAQSHDAQLGEMQRESARKDAGVESEQAKLALQFVAHLKGGAEGAKGTRH